MRIFPRRTSSAMLACGLGIASLLVAATPASAAVSPLPMDCQAKPPVGGTQQLLLDTTVDTTAPATVASGANFDVALAAGSLLLPTTAGGFAINNVRNLKLKLPIPAGTSLVSTRISGGSNIGTGIPSIAVAGGAATLTVPGPIPGGATFQLPVVTATLTATGAAGSTIVTKLAGTSYADPGLTLTANVRAVIINIDVPVNCFANPNPTLSTTSVVAPA